MAYCMNCGSQLPENATICEKCGTPVNSHPYGTPAPIYVDPYDHTAEFDAADVSENKVFAMAAYLLSILGIILAMLAAPNSKYAAFHARQALKLTLVTTLVSIISALLCWTIIVPIVGAVCALVLLVIHIICFFQVCAGKAKEVPIVCSLGFLK